MRLKLRGFLGVQKAQYKQRAALKRTPGRMLARPAQLTSSLQDIGDLADARLA